MIKSAKFQNIAKYIINREQHNTVGRLCEFIDQCLLNFPNEIGQYFPFIHDLFKFCNNSYSSTVYMFIDIMNINITCQTPEFWTNFLIEDKYFVLNKLDDQSDFYKLPSTLLYAMKNPTTCDNWKFLVKLTDFPEHLHDLGFLVNESANLIKPLVYEIDDITDGENHFDNFKNKYEEIQVHAIEFLTKMMEFDSIRELTIPYEQIVNNILKVMKFFQHHNFALKACVNFIIASITSDYMKEEIISIIYPFFIQTIEKNDINERFLISFCKFCIDQISLIDDNLNEFIPESILQQCYGWSKICSPKT